MIDWYTSSLKDLYLLQDAAVNNNVFGNNYSAVNTFLYKNKFDSKISIINDWIVERNSDENNFYFSFPHNVKGECSNFLEIISILENEAASCRMPFIFKNITADEKKLLLDVYPSSEVQIAAECSDYIYLRDNLSNLPGHKYSKKRNHVNQFIKKYDDFAFEKVSSENLKYIYEIEENWLKESTDSDFSQDYIKDLNIEKEIIFLALDNFEYLKKECKMSGGILFVKNKPAAFCISSNLSKDVTDVHFEKCLSEYAAAGGYAVINQQFAKTVSTKYINREEDLGIEGLRKAKLSYYPEIILNKFNVIIKNG